jgi:hypothetical protein
MNKWIQRSALLLFWPLGFLLLRITASSSKEIDIYYSQGFSKILAGYLSRITGVLPFSLAEILVWLTLISFTVYICRGVIRHLCGRKKKKGKGVSDLLLKWLIAFGVVYFCFIVVWGLNYNRLSFAEIAEFKADGFAEKDLVQLCEKLIDRANQLRVGLPEDDRGVMYYQGGFEKIRREAPTAFRNASSVFPEMGGQFGRPKPVFFSKWMSYTGISGIYFPFTAEANVNVDIPDSLLPATTCHEMAHQRGFAREDEANYLAWVTCCRSDDQAFQYSGTLLAVIHSMNALYAHDPEQANALRKKYGEGLHRDLLAISSYWRQYEGKVEELASDVNDAYLKSNRQEEGVRSYGRMVDLLLAEQQAEPLKRILP